MDKDDIDLISGACLLLGIVIGFLFFLCSITSDPNSWRPVHHTLATGATFASPSLIILAAILFITSRTGLPSFKRTNNDYSGNDLPNGYLQKMSTTSLQRVYQEIPPILTTRLKDKTKEIEQLKISVEAVSLSAAATQELLQR